MWGWHRTWGRDGDGVRPQCHPGSADVVASVSEFENEQEFPVSGRNTGLYRQREGISGCGTDGHSQIPDLTGQGRGSLAQESRSGAVDATCMLRGGRQSAAGGGGESSPWGNEMLSAGTAGAGRSATGAGLRGAEGLLGQGGEP